MYTRSVNRTRGVHFFKYKQFLFTTVRISGPFGKRKLKQTHRGGQQPHCFPSVRSVMAQQTPAMNRILPRVIGQ